MEPVPFPGCNANLSAPGCYDLPVFVDSNVSISKWKLTRAEIAELERTGEIWLSIWMGGRQPPVQLSVKPLVQIAPPP